VQIDIALGDRVVPGPEEIDFPTLLDLPANFLMPVLSAVAKQNVFDQFWKPSEPWK